MKHGLVAACMLASLYSQAGYSEGALAYQKGDYATALQEWLAVAGQGNTSAQFNLGLMHANGQGVAKDEAQAAAWYRKAADQGHVKAQYNLALALESGLGLAKDPAQAVHWYRKAAEQGHAEAQYNLAAIYHQGSAVPRDYQQAALWYGKAAQHGDFEAVNNLGVLYMQGDGVPRSMVAAYALYSLSISMESSAANRAVANRMKLAKILRRDEIEAAERLVPEIAKPGNLMAAVDGYIQLAQSKDQNRAATATAMSNGAAGVTRTAK